MDESTVVSPDVTEAPSATTETATDVATTAEVTTPGETPVTTPEPTPTQTVPFERFQEVNNKTKELEAQLQELQAQVNPAPVDESSNLDPDAEKMLQAWAKREGFVSKSQLDAQASEIAFTNDMADLTTKNKGFTTDKVAEYAKGNLGGTGFLTTKAAYQLVWDKMTEGDRIEAARKAAIAEAANPTATAERPGQGGAKPPTESETTKPRNVTDRIRAARERISGS